MLYIIREGMFNTRPYTGLDNTNDELRQGHIQTIIISFADTLSCMTILQVVLVLAKGTCYQNALVFVYLVCCYACAVCVERL